MSRVLNKLIAVMIVILLIGTNLIFLATESIAASSAYDSQNSRTNNSNVEFNAYLEGGVHETSIDMSSQDMKIYLNISVQNIGYLKSAEISFENANFSINPNEENSYIKSVDKENNKIQLNQINKGENVVIEIPIQFLAKDDVTSDYLNKEFGAHLVAEYIDEDGKSISIDKTILNKLTWTAETEIENTMKINKYIPYKQGEKYGVLLQMLVNNKVKDNKVPVKTSKTTITVPEINGTKPSSVSVMANNTKATNGQEDGINFNNNNYAYDAENNTLTITVENEADGNNMIKWKKDATDEYIVTFIYEGQDIYNKVVELQNKAAEQAEESTQREITNRSEIERNNIENTTANEENAVVNEENANSVDNQENTIAEENTNSEETTNSETNTAINELNIETNIKVEDTLYTFDGQTITKDFNYSNELKEKIGEMTTAEISATNEISKGYIYANYDIEKEEDKKETTYGVKYVVNVENINIVDRVEFKEQIDKFKGEEKEGEEQLEGATTVGDKNYTYNKEIKVSKTIFDKMLGEEGKIEVFDNTNNKIGEINKDTEVNSSNEYAIDISEANKNQIVIRTSKPITEGKIEINITKAIAKNIDYSIEQMREFKTIETSMIGNVIEDSSTKTAKINMVEPKSEASIAINKEQLSTVTENSNVELRATLDTSSVYNSLYKDPTIKIELPEVIENVEVNSIKMLYADGLKIKEATLSEEDGKKVIDISIEGTQTEYSTENQDVKGPNIIVNTNMELDKLGTNQDAEIKMQYTNNANTESEDEAEEKEAKTDIPIIAPTGVIATNEVSNYKEGAKDVLEIEDGTKELTIDTYSDARDVVFGGQVINNYDNAISDVVVLGRLPVQGNKNVDTNADLGSNMNMTLKQGISIQGMDTSNIKVYYSSNVDATNDLSGQANGWTENPSNLAEMKSYLIVVQNTQLATGEGFQFNYTAELAGNIAYNNTTNTMYKVFYNNISDIGTIAETKVSPIIKLTTGEGPEIEVTLSSSIPEGTAVGNGQYVRFYVTVKNNGDIEAENVKLNIPIPEHMRYVEFEEIINEYNLDEDATNYEIDLGNIKSGESKEVDYELVAYISGVGGTIDTMSYAELTAGNISGKIKSNEYKIVLDAQLPHMKIVNEVNTEESRTYSEGSSIRYNLKITSNTATEFKNITATIPLPDDVEVKNAYIESDSDNITEGVQISSDKVIVTIPTLESSGTKNVVVEFTIGENTPASFSSMVTVASNDIGTRYSNERWIYTGRESMTGEQLAPSKEYVKENEEFKYTFEINTEGTADIFGFVLEDQLPSELDLISSSVQLTNLDGSESEYSVVGKALENEEGIVTLKISRLPKNSILTITLTVSGRLQSEADDGKELVNKAYIYGDKVDRIELNSTTVYLEYVPLLHDNPTGSGAGNRFSISGTTWLDENQDGMRDGEETTISGVQALLLYKSNGQLVTDVDSGESKIVTTGEDGRYQFTNLTPNQYLVVFVYDAGLYSITTYQKEGVNESRNSDAIETNINLNGTRQIAGVTDTLQVSNDSIRNIDLGLYQDEKFDLSVEKYITKISLTTPTIGTAQYEYGDSVFEKVEILGQNAGRSSMVMEYKIVIKNEGGVAGYARKIVDYLPEGVGFSTDLNRDWYLSETNGNIYNTSLENTIIQPGETKELTLILTKQITEDTIGTTLSNQAEIYESYNEEGLKDIDSTEANRETEEDDLGQADVLVSLVTGKIIMYTGIIIVVLAMITTGIIVIKKKVLTKNK